MTSSERDPDSGDFALGAAHSVDATAAGERPIALVAQIAEALPDLDDRELSELADAVEALTEAIGLRMDWDSS